uniref:Uncharacterized protein n=1 Tax=Calcidiscus leptoporus TaxID=127549 RepID=A0A7S0NRF7_9EUKA|mmetsp:Transcript_19631/g.45127  ORF Transcript_19631/g.45127 Transcript_19631/m.45127 type:complete len:186 (+) Transcript_19631:107-664(+)
MLDVLSANVASVARLLPRQNDPERRTAVRHLVQRVLSPVLEHVAACAEQQEQLVVSLTSGWDAPRGPSPYEPLLRFKRFLCVRDDVVAVYLAMLGEELTRLEEAPAELIDRPLVAALSLIMYALLTFCEAMARVGGQLEQVAATHPIMEIAALGVAARREAGVSVQPKASSTATGDKDVELHSVG